MNGTVIIDPQNGLTLKGHIVPSIALSATVVNNTKVLVGHVAVSTEHESYSGDYNVTPQINSQVLNTSDKLMAKDMVIKAIPYYSVSNEYDGETVIIGGNN